MTITHHLDDATLMSFAAGSLPNALAAVAAAHVALCPRCRKAIEDLERVGGALLSDLAPAGIGRAMAAPLPAADSSPPQRAAVRDSELPAPIAHLMAGGLDAVRWRWIGPGLWHHRLPLQGSGELQLLKAAPGRSVPEHGHHGAELTLVLRGTLVDAMGRFKPGDVADLDESIEHQPAAGTDGECICLIASEKPARFRGLLARLVQPWHGM